MYRTNGPNGCIIVTDEIHSRELNQTNYLKMKELNKKFTDVQGYFEQFVERDLNLPVPM